jgi:hypothetical protein
LDRHRWEHTAGVTAVERLDTVIGGVGDPEVLEVAVAREGVLSVLFLFEADRTRPVEPGL